MKDRGPSVTIDIHSHFFPILSSAQSKILDPNKGPWLDVRSKGYGMIMTGNKEYRPVRDSLWCPERRVEELDQNGVDIQIVCATPLLFGYSKPPRVTRDWAQLINDLTLEHCANVPSRLRPLAQVPLQDVEMACATASQAKEDGHVGVQIGNHVGDRDLDHPHLVEFLIHCANEEIPVLVHPWDMTESKRTSRYMLQWLVDMPAETQLSILALILSGAFEKLPRMLKICFAHGGGSFAYLLGRLDNAWEYRDIVRQDCPNKPSSYVDRFYVDSAVFDHRSLRLLRDVMGSNRIMFGTDYPFPLGEQELGSLIRSSSGFDEFQKQQLLGLNAKDFFAID